MGTECGRQTLHPNIWINALFADYNKPHTRPWTDAEVKKEHESNTALSHPGIHTFYDRLEMDYPNWIITDVRFPDEVKAIEDRGGIVIRLDDSNRKVGSIYDEAGVTTRGAWRAAAAGMEHESETALDNHNFKYVIQNDGSIEDLVEKVKQVLNE